MEYGIALKPIIPMRSEPSECSEMVSQLMFGETFRIVRQEPKWLLIENYFDGYQGWIDSKMATVISPEEYDALNAGPLYYFHLPLTDLSMKGTKGVMRLSIGCVLPGYDPQRNRAELGGNIYNVNVRNMSIDLPRHIKTLIRTAEYYLHAPYLWGGRSIMGVDCSGFVQSVYRMHGYKLPRDASQQINYGEHVEFEDIRPGDLAFFRNEKGNVSHVGIIYTPTSIIHASGDVHIDKLTKEGIWSEQRQCYTHSAPIIRRMTDMPKR